MALGRISRFAKVPAGARRVSVMRRGSAGIKVLAPSMALLKEFEARKKAFIAKGMDRDEAHALAADRIDYRARFRREILGNPEAVAALRALIEESRARDVYLMCMCAPRTLGEACHTYLLLEIARELDPRVEIATEP
jgi:hypothetical protein